MLECGAQGSARELASNTCSCGDGVHHAKDQPTVGRGEVGRVDSTPGCVKGLKGESYYDTGNRQSEVAGRGSQLSQHQQGDDRTNKRAAL